MVWTDLTEAEDTKKWQEYTKQLCKTRSSWPRYSQWYDHSPRARYPGMQSQWALGSITMNKTSGVDGIPGEQFQILKDDAVKVLHSICQQIWKTQQWPQDWNRSVFSPIPKKGNAKESPAWPCPIYLISWTWKSWFLYNVILYSNALCFHQTHPKLSIISALAQLFILSGAISLLLVAYWMPTSLGGSSSGIISFCLLILPFGILRQKYWSGLVIPFSSGPCFP